MRTGRSRWMRYCAVIEIPPGPLIEASLTFAYCARIGLGKRDATSYRPGTHCDFHYCDTVHVGFSERRFNGNFGPPIIHVKLGRLLTRSFVYCAGKPDQRHAVTAYCTTGAVSCISRLVRSSAHCSRAARKRQVHETVCAV